MGIIREDTARVLVEGNADNLTEANIAAIEKAAISLLEPLQLAYESIAPSKSFDYTLNLDTRRLIIHFAADKTEAILETRLSFKNGQTFLDGTIARPNKGLRLAINELAITLDTADILLTRLLDDGFIQNTRASNHVPFLDDDALAPLGNTAPTAQSDAPIHVLDTAQSAYINEKFQNLRNIFNKRHGHMFPRVFFDMDPKRKRFSITANGTAHGSFDLVWRNKGRNRTRLMLNFNNASALDIATTDAATADALYKILTNLDAESSREIIRQKHAAKIPPRMRRSLNRTDRRTANMDLRNLLNN